MDWLISILAISGTFLVAKKIKWGWVAFCLSNVTLAFYAFSFHPPQYGLLPSAIINFGSSIMGLIKWFDIDINKLIRGHNEQTK
jgi:hypothetical protein